MLRSCFFLTAVFSFLAADLLLSRSPTASAAERFVLTGHNLKPRQPQLALDRNGGLHLVFGSGNNLYHCLSGDGGATFTDAVSVGSAKFLSLGMRRGPRVAMTSDTCVITAVGGERGGGRDGDLLAWRSADMGKSWLGPTRVNDVDGSAREGLHAMAASPAGDVYCAWLDLRNKRTEIVGASSRDGGKTWTENHLVYRSPDGSVCECCHPSAAFAPDGTLYVMWRNSRDGNRDMYVAESKDGGQSFADAIRLGAHHWQLAACPMDGGAIAIDSQGAVHTAWRRDKSVYTTSGDAPRDTKVSDGEQPWLAITEHGPALAWISSRPGDLLVKLPWTERAASIATGARDPGVIALDDSDVVAWETERDGAPSIIIERLDPEPAAAKN